MGWDMSPIAVKVRPLENYHVLIEFETGEVKKYDVSPHIRGSWYGELADKEYFKTVYCDGMTIVWGNGQDICPDNIYIKGQHYEGLFGATENSRKAPL